MLVLGRSKGVLGAGFTTKDRRRAGINNGQSYCSSDQQRAELLLLRSTTGMVTLAEASTGRVTLAETSTGVSVTPTINGW